MFAKTLPLAALALTACATPAAPPALSDAEAGRQAWAAACKDFDEWDKPGPPFRIYGQTYYVGTCGIAALLVVDAKGHTLIDSGTDKGAEVVLANITALGFDPRDVSTILMSHEHFDHVGGMARLQAATGAKIVATKEAVEVLRSGKPSPQDPQAGSGHPPFAPVTGPVAALDHPDAALPAHSRFRSIATPGHTLGATSWTWEECEEDRCEQIAYLDSMNPISDDSYRFSDHPALVADFRKGIAEVAAMRCGIALAPHPGAVALRARVLSGNLRDSEGCKAHAATAAQRLDARLAKEAAGG